MHVFDLGLTRGKKELEIL